MDLSIGGGRDSLAIGWLEGQPDGWVEIQPCSVGMDAQTAWLFFPKVCLAWATRTGWIAGIVCSLKVVRSAG